MADAQHAVFLNMAATGHVNPTLPLAAELRARGVAVTYFVDDSVRPVVEATGASWRHFQDPKKLTEEQTARYLPADATPEDAQFPVCTLVASASCLPKFLEELRALEPKPSVLLYDPFLPMGLVAAKVLSIPAVATLTMTGPGVVQVAPFVQQRWESSGVARAAHREVLEAYGVDVFQQGTFMEFYSPDLNLVSTSRSLYVGPSTPLQLERFPDFPFECVGPLLNAKQQRLEGRLGTSKASGFKLLEGKKKLYVSPGTVATGHFWNMKFGPQAGKNGLDEATGKEFVQKLLGTIIEALKDEDLQVIISTGGQEDVLEGLPELPPHWIAEASLPQLELLPQCDAFITHGGANSIHEALFFQVPMAVVPIFGDQPQNADVIARAGCGVSFRRPLESFTVPKLREAMQKLLAGDFREGTRAVSEELKNAGGVPKAVDEVLKLALNASSKLGGA